MLVNDLVQVMLYNRAKKQVGMGFMQPTTFKIGLFSMLLLSKPCSFHKLVGIHPIHAYVWYTPTITYYII